jgi:hypothetical protein
MPGPSLLVALACLALQAPTGRLSLTFIDTQDAPAPCLVRLTDREGKVIPPPPGLTAWAGHFSCPGQFTADLPPGSYTYAADRGPEHLVASGTVAVEAGKTATATARLNRIADLRSVGWFSGDLRLHRLPADAPLLLDAADLDYGAVVTWTDKADHWDGRDLPAPLRPITPSGRAYDLMAGEDNRAGGPLVFLGLDRPLDLSRVESPEIPSTLDFVAEALRLPGDVHLDAANPLCWDFATWAGLGQVGSVNLAVPPGSAAAGPLGPGDDTRLALEVYDRLLEAGLTIPPSAGSGSGLVDRPPGTGRVYVELPGLDRIDPDRWREGLRAGRSFVTDGPLLLCRAEGVSPGNFFRAKLDTELSIRLEIAAWSRDPIKTIQVIRDGRVAESFGPGPNGGVPGPVSRISNLKFSRAGWFLVRVHSDSPSGPRFASTAPYYVEVGDVPRISAEACRYFLHWIERRIDQIKATLPDSPARARLLSFHDEAIRAWENRLGLASVE